MRRFLREHGRSVLIVGMQPLVQLGTLAVVASSLSADEAGRYFIITALTPVLADFVGLSSSEAVIRQAAHDERKVAQGLYSFVVYFALTYPVAIGIYVLTISPISHAWFGISAAIAFACLDIAGNRLVALSEHLGIAIRQHLMADLARLMLPLSRLTGIGAGVFLFGWRDGPSLALTGAAGLFAFGVLAGLWVVRAVGLPKPGDLIPLRLCLAFSLSQAARNAQQNLDRYVLAFMLPASQIAVYAITTRIAQAAALPVQVVIRNNYRDFFEHGRRGRIDAVEHAFRIAIPTLSMGVFGGASILVLSPVLPLVFGPSYADSAHLARYLAAMPAAWGVFYLTASVLSGIDRQMTRSMIAFLGVGAQLATLSVLVPFGGVLAAVLAAYVAPVASSFVIWLVLRRLLAMPA